MNNLFPLRKTRAATAMILLMLLALSFVVRAVVPAGFMPAQNGTYELVVCSGMGVKTVLMNADGTPAENSGHKEKQSDICAYQILASQQNVPTPVLNIVPADTAVLKISFTAPKTNISSYITSSQPARGPPSFLI